MQKSAAWLEKHSPKKIISTDGYITITGAKNITNKIREMLEKTELRLYMMASAEVLGEFENELTQIVKAGKKVVLLTKDFKNPDLIIRTSGEQRISNFLLYQMAYSELYFTNTYWPDFDKKCLEMAICNYQKRNRRFGAIKE